MFTGMGHRPNTEQTIRLGAKRDGRLIAIHREETDTSGMGDDNFEPVAGGTAGAYACANVATRDLQRRLNIPPPGWMRAPGEAEGIFALEPAIDELAYELGMDPLDFRLRNYAEVDPRSGLPWASKALRECYEVGAERFGWAGRDPEVSSMRDGRWQVGYGLAGVTYNWWQVRCKARATINGDGTAYVCSAANDPGTGTTTVMQQLSAELLGLPLDHVTFEGGDSDLPWSPASGGSGLTAQSEPHRGEDAVAVFADRSGELDERFGLGSGGPRQPGVEVFGGLAGVGEVVEQPELFLEQERSVEPLVGEGDLGQAGELRLALALGSFQQRPADVLDPSSAVGLALGVLVPVGADWPFAGPGTQPRPRSRACTESRVGPADGLVAHPQWGQRSRLSSHSKRQRLTPRSRCRHRLVR
jgi:hypothetical protein